MSLGFCPVNLELSEESSALNHDDRSEVDEKKHEHQEVEEVSDVQKALYFVDVCVKAQVDIDD